MVVARRIRRVDCRLLRASMVDLPPTTKFACARFELSRGAASLERLVALAAAKCAACAFLQHRFDRLLGVRLNASIPQ